ncbi:unnamed protein product [Phaedon cochleariae]|uniref:BLUF domain-containing protein n=1 Tax=Phaedon cochleariae TaxID=80249 RepID=A0A9P0DSA8_PHACE|nr:unnamed protein product [Phaedon cochleariae]
MNREVKVNYPKRRTQLKESKQQGLQPPVRRNMYEIVLENFQIARRVTFLHRIIYVGEHTFPPNGDMIKQCFSSCINIVNDSNCLESLTGFLLYYNRYFVHLVEGDEDSLNAHIGILLSNEKFQKHLKVMKLIINVSHINQRFIMNWNCCSGVPSKLLSEFDENCSLEDSGRIIFNCVKKMYATVTSFVEDSYSPDTRLLGKTSLAFGRESVINRSAMMDSSFQRHSSRNMSSQSLRSGSVGGGVSNPYRSTLPEIEVLNFIINSNFTQHLSDYYSKYGVVPQRDIYKDKVWPVPSDFIPYDIFTKLYENVTELPKSKPKTNQTETTNENDHEENVTDDLLQETVEATIIDDN